MKIIKPYTASVRQKAKNTQKKTDTKGVGSNSCDFGSQ